MIIIAPPKKGINKYKIMGDYTIIYIYRKKNNTTYECYIDTEDLQKLIDLEANYFSWGFTYE